MSIFQLFSALFRFLHRSYYYVVYIMAYEHISYVLLVFLSNLRNLKSRYVKFTQQSGYVEKWQHGSKPRIMHRTLQTQMLTHE